jgi:pyrimidine operon attenuation protein/uracil phosphoribosyltransferase
MPEKKNIILDSDSIQKKIARISYEIYENNYEEKEIILAGIKENGYELAQRLKTKLEAISKIKVSLISLTVSKSDPVNTPIKTDLDLKAVKDKCVIIVDDVAHSGRTLSYAMKPLLDHSPRKIQVAVLVDRKHKKFPVSADYVGLLLATGMKEMITVSLGKNEEAYVE